MGGSAGAAGTAAAIAEMESSELRCPFCGELDEIDVDAGGGDAQVYTEDCAVCCRPRIVHVEPGNAPGEVRVWLERGE
jgi:hypothetical protein